MTENPFQKQRSTINCGGSLIDFDSPKVMGILNVTPDSFYDGGRHQTEKEITERIQQMMNDGADFIDVGAVSSRPGSVQPDQNEELKRLIPVLKILKNRFPNTLVSLDTYRSEVAKIAVESYNVSLINDISCGQMDEKMFETIGKLNVPYIAMHMKGTPANMQKNTDYLNIVNDILQYFSLQTKKMKDHGIIDIIIDPGFGFGKSTKDNFKLLKEFQHFSMLGYPLLAGISRKSMIYKTLETTPDMALTGTISANMLALINGADILRVHDVKEASETIKIFKAYKQS
ncbi:MAG: dihydropteroate synthase [Bacteroidetes bacterium HGW-Bacteroidetes-21]|nr:MAG: dihydropteroate synthase [Bacteroidetes bacterium HGW-Bacteroidetes-21]